MSSPSVFPILVFHERHHTCEFVDGAECQVCVFGVVRAATVETVLPGYTGVSVSSVSVCFVTFDLSLDIEQLPVDVSRQNDFPRPRTPNEEAF